MQTANDNSKHTLKAFQTTLVLNSFKWVLHLGTTAIGNHIKYYLTTNRGNFLEIQYGFYKCALQIYYGLFLKEDLPRTQKRFERDCLEHHCERSLKLSDDWSSTQVSLFLLTGEVGIVNVQGCGMHC